MAGITHAFVSAIADGGDASLVQPSNWNAGHTLTGIAVTDGINTFAATQTFTVAPVFTDASGTRTALGLGTLATASTVTEAMQTLADNVTANASTTAHGYLKKLSNVVTEYMDGTGNWSVPAGGAGAPFIDSTAIIKGSADATKLWRVEVDGFTTGTTRVATPPNADFTMAGLEVTQTFTASQTWTGTANRFGTATTNDALADTMMSVSATTQKALVLQMKASQTASPFVVQTSAGVACTSVQSDGGMIIDQRTGATYANPLDVRYQGTILFTVPFGGGANVYGNLVFQAVANNISFGGNTFVGAGQAGGIVKALTSASAVPGGVSSQMEVIKAVAAITDAAATTVFTVTIPNASHSAMVRVTLVGKIGAGGAIGAGEATGTIAYDIAIARTAGVNAVGGISAAYGSITAAVAGATTITVAGTLGAVVGAVGASNTIPIQVTITKGGGASANHTCLATCRLLNANATGVSIA